MNRLAQLKKIALSLEEITSNKRGSTKRVKILGASVMHPAQLADIGCRWAVLYQGSIVATRRTEAEAHRVDKGSEVLPLERCTNEQLSYYCTARNLFFIRG